MNPSNTIYMYVIKQLHNILSRTIFKLIKLRVIQYELDKIIERRECV